MFRKMPFILLAIIISILLFNPLIPLSIKQDLYALSLTVKSFILLLLPLVIFSLLFKTIVGMAQRATTLIFLIIGAVCCSNAVATFLMHYVGAWIYQFNLSVIIPEHTQELVPAWTWQFPQLIANNKAMLLGFVAAMVMNKFKPKMAEQIAARLEWLITRILQSFFYLIIVFVIGFVVKLQYEGVIQTILKDYTVIFGLVALAQLTYIFLAYFALNRFNLLACLRSIKNMLPAAMAGFSTMSSAAVMPLTIMGVEKNVKNKDLARAVIPATVNIHLLGDCFAIPIFAFAVMKSYGFSEPALMSYLAFVGYFVVAKFSAAAIPGGGIVVMLPVLESCFGFNAPMLSLITALYILLDPVITCANVLGNGALAKLIDKLAAFRAVKTNLPTEDVALRPLAND